MPRAVKVKIDRQNVRRLMEGREVVINLPPDASELHLKLDTTDEELRNAANKLSSLGRDKKSNMDELRKMFGGIF
jgi:hypothetical protein